MKRLIVGMSGASAAIYGIRLLEVLRETDVETHLVISSAAKKIILMETDFTVEEVEMMADHVYDIDDIGQLSPAALSKPTVWLSYPVPSKAYQPWPIRTGRTCCCELLTLP
jgi:3-polyprenyl-4-hydroxybenzoate decarboxylase